MLSRPQFNRVRSLKSAMWHGTPDEGTWQTGSASGIHVGTKEAARQALNARIGRPADGSDWEGSREYGKTLLAGYGKLDNHTGYDSQQRRAGRVDDHYPSGTAQYGGTGDQGVKVPLTAHPKIFPVRITGPMTNYRSTPHGDWHANGYMRAQIKQGRAKSGYYYTNVGEDDGSISAVVPGAPHLERLDPKPQFDRLWHDRRS